jgi:NADPH:quinone reductase-like Zn-dependent oxidoreductase
MMKAIVLDEFGTEPVLRSIERPSPARGEVLVRVEASGVNPLDLKIMAGAAGHARVTPPMVLGLDLAGVVTEIGTGVTRFDVGDEVYGLTGGVGNRQGSLAEYASVDADLLARKPARLSMTEAAALPLAAITAWEGLVDRAGVHAGQTVLVHGGAGSVGHVAVQLAIARGATVFATGSAQDLEAIRNLGAEPIDYRATPVEKYVATATGGAGFDVIFDTVGGETLDTSFTAVRTYTGHVVSILGWGTHSLAPLSFRGATYSGVFTLLPLLTGEGHAHHGEILTATAALVDAGLMTPVLDPTPYDLETVAGAHRAVASGNSRGKVVVRI